MDEFKDGKVSRKEADLIAAAGKRQSGKRLGRKAKKEEEILFLADKNWPFKIRRAVFQVIRGGIWVFALFIALAFGAVGFHLVAPQSWKWLGPTEVHALTDVVGFIGSSAFGVFLGKYLRRLFSELDEKPNWN